MSHATVPGVPASCGLTNVGDCPTPSPQLRGTRGIGFCLLDRHPPSVESTRVLCLWIRLEVWRKTCDKPSICVTPLPLQDIALAPPVAPAHVDLANLVRVPGPAASSLCGDGKGMAVCTHLGVLVSQW